MSHNRSQPSVFLFLFGSSDVALHPWIKCCADTATMRPVCGQQLMVTAHVPACVLDNSQTTRPLHLVLSSADFFFWLSYFQHTCTPMKLISMKNNTDLIFLKLHVTYRKHLVKYPQLRFCVTLQVDRFLPWQVLHLFWSCPRIWPHQVWPQSQSHQTPDPCWHTPSSRLHSSGRRQRKISL